MVPAICVLACALPVSAQSGAKNGEWRTYGGDLGNTHYSPLDQINAGNFSKLQVAWRFKTDNLGPRPEFNFEGTPLMANGVIYSTAGTRRAVVALDAATGELLWVHGEHEGARGTAAPRQLSGRGLAYWTDGREERILYVTPGYRLVALDAKTGNPVPAFGNGGMVDLKLEDDQEIDLVTGEVGLHATPVVANDVVIVGAAHRPGGVAKSKTNVKGFVRGFDVRTGKRLWIFHTIPRSDEFGYDTWEKDSASYTGNTGVWGQISVDEQLGMAFIPVELPTGDYYGGHRPGNGLFGETVLAVDLKTGQAQMALPIGAPRNLGHGYSVRADAGGHHRERPDREGGRAADQASFPLCVRSDYRQADLADRGAAGGAVHGARRKDQPHATVPHQAARLTICRVSRIDDVDRFHA